MGVEKRRILLVSLGIPFGGAEIYSGRLAQLLQDRAMFYAFCGSARFADFLRSSGVNVISYNAVFRHGKLQRAEYLLRCCAKLPALRWKYKIDTIWAQSFQETMLIPIARLFGCKGIATMHVTLVPSIAQNIFPYAIFSANKVICVSRSVAESLPRFVPAVKLAVVLNWVSFLPEPKIERQRDESLLRLLYVGRLEKYKGASLIIEAMRLLKSRQPQQRVSLTIAGDGPYRQELEKEAAGLEVEFTGFLTDPSRAYQSADLFIHPTFGPEGAPLVSIEAMAHGLPCILSDIGVNREVTDDGESSLLFRSGDPHDLCAKIELFAATPELLKEYGERGRTKVIERHIPEVARRRYIEEIGL